MHSMHFSDKASLGIDIDHHDNANEWILGHCLIRLFLLAGFSSAGADFNRRRGAVESRVDG